MSENEKMIGRGLIANYFFIDDILDEGFYEMQSAWIREQTKQRDREIMNSLIPAVDNCVPECIEHWNPLVCSIELDKAIHDIIANLIPDEMTIYAASVKAFRIGKCYDTMRRLEERILTSGDQKRYYNFDPFITY